MLPQPVANAMANEDVLIELLQDSGEKLPLPALLHAGGQLACVLGLCWTIQFVANCI